MEDQNISSEAIIEFATGGIAYTPGDDILTDIWNFLTGALSSAISAVSNLLHQVWDSVVNTVVNNINSLWNAVYSWYTSLATRLTNIVSTINSIGTTLVNWVASAYSTVYSAVTSALTSVNTWINNLYTRVANYITTELDNLRTFVNNALSSLGQSFTSFLSQLGADIQGVKTALSTTVSALIANAVSSLTGIINVISAHIDAAFTWLTGWITDNVVTPLSGVWDAFYAKLLNFTDWVPRLFDAVSAWVTRDVPGSSPWYKGVWDWIMVNFFGYGTQYYLFDFSGFEHGMAKAATTTFSFVGNMFQTAFDEFHNGLTQYVGTLAPMSPDQAVVNYGSLMKVGMGALIGLAGMTIAGELLNPISYLGLGHIAAMIYDMTNYKLITGAMIGTLAAIVLRIPLTYYYNAQFRPRLPEMRDAQQIFAMDDITRDQFGQLLGYHGYADSWHDMYADSAYVAPSLYSLSSLITGGSYDRTIFTDILRRRRVPPAMRTLLLDMYQKKANADVKAYGLTNALTRLKTGLTTEDQCTSELQVLHAADVDIPTYIAAAKIAYATDYTNELITAFTDAVRAGNIGIDDFRSNLLALGLVPDMVEARVLIEVARVKPSKTPTSVTPAKAYYLTPAGILAVDTVRRQRRKKVITRDQEMAALQTLGMDTDYAGRIADNDDIRLGETVTAG